MCGILLNYSYTVSDGLHEVSSVLTVIASDPFVRIENSSITIPSDNAAMLLPVTSHNLSAISSVDSRDSDIWFTVSTENWIIVANSTEKMVKKFTQQVILISTFSGHSELSRWKDKNFVLIFSKEVKRNVGSSLFSPTPPIQLANMK